MLKEGENLLKEKEIIIEGKSYFISEDGTIKNSKYKIINQAIDKVGYHSIVVKRKRYLVHRLVAKAFIPDFLPELQVHHIDENKGNNNVNNLVCMSQKEHQHLHKQIYPLTKICMICGKEFTPHKTKRKRAKTCSYECWLQTVKRTTDSQKTRVMQYDIDGNLLKVWDSISDIQKDLGFFASNICKCCKGNIKSYKGYVWRYAD